MTTGSSSRKRDTHASNERHVSVPSADPAEISYNDKNEHKAPIMKRKCRQPERLSYDDNRIGSSSSSSSNVTSSSQLAAVTAANDDPLFLLQYVQQNPDVYRRVIYEMAMAEFDQKTTTESSSSGSGSSKSDGEATAVMSIMEKGFLWKEFKPIEQLLWHNAAESFRLGLSSTGGSNKLKCAFHDQLVNEIRQTAAQHNILMSDYFDEDKILRDRIRGFYKTITQNVRRRLATMAKKAEKSREYLSAILLRIASREEEEGCHGETSRTSPTASWEPDQLTESTHAATFVSPETVDPYYSDSVAGPILDSTTSRKKQRAGVVHLLDASTAVLLPSHYASAAALDKIPLLLEVDDNHCMDADEACAISHEAQAVETQHEWTSLQHHTTPSTSTETLAVSTTSPGTIITTEALVVMKTPVIAESTTEITATNTATDTSVAESNAHQSNAIEARVTMNRGTEAFAPKPKGTDPPTTAAAMMLTKVQAIETDLPASGDTIMAGKRTSPNANAAERTSSEASVSNYTATLGIPQTKTSASRIAEAVEHVQVTVEPSSKQAASAEKASEDGAQVHSDRSELLNASQDSTELEPGANSPLSTYKAPENARIPSCGTDEWTIWNRLNVMGRGVAESYSLAKDSPLIHLRTVHELIRTRLAAGMLRTALKLCHNSIMNIYDDAEEAARSLPAIEPLKRIRTELAGAWCLYAHILWEIGALDKGCTIHGATDQRKVAMSTLRQPHHVWEKHAVTVLKAATSCPLAGNHSWITLATARLTILQSLGNNGSSSISTSKTPENIRIAITMCWESIHRARGDPIEPRVPRDGSSEEAMSLLANHELCFSPLLKEKVTVGVLKESFEAVSALPIRLLRICSTPFIFDDKNSILALRNELNRLSRLQGKLGQLPNVPLSPVGYGCDEVDSFALFRARDVAPDTTTLSRGRIAQETLVTSQAKPRVPSLHSPGAPEGGACANIEHGGTKC